VKPSAIINRTLAFFREGYPPAAPRHGYLPALALLPQASTSQSTR
jgi:hypothetical protein